MVTRAFSKRNPGVALRKAQVLGPAALLLSIVAVSFPASTRPSLQLWYWQHSDLTSDAAVESSKALINRAAKSGYTGVAFWDNSFAYLSDGFWPRANVEHMHDAMQYATSKGLRVLALGAPFGWSNGALAANGNWAEAQRVIGARFTVDTSGKHLNFVNSLPPLRNAGFEEGRTGWFGTGDPATGLNDNAHSGHRAAVIIDATGNARFRQKITLTPWRQYHLRLWFRSSNFRGQPGVEVQDWWHRGVVRFQADLEANGTLGWTRVDYAFNSQATSSAYLYFGVWGGSKGILWFDDVQLEETALVYVVRREGTPLMLYDAEDAKFTYREGPDYNYIYDPRLSPPRAAFRDVYHPPPVVTLPPGTHLRPGQGISVDFYAVFPLARDNQVGMCLTEPAVFEWLVRNARAIREILPPDGGILLSYDEMRQMNSCESCRAKNMTAGQLLAWNVHKTVGLYHSTAPGTALYIWSDMFDPYHNAVNHYYQVDGDLAGSWTGLPASVTVLNWNHSHLKQSLAWFAGLDKRQPVKHEQIIAGYYDSGSSAAAQQDLAQAEGIPGITGLMYVTWRDDYSQLESFAKSARAAWNSYAMNSTSSR